MRDRFILAVLLALAACGGGEQQGANATSADSADVTAGGDSSSGAPAPQAATVRLRPGQWEITSEMAAMNVPGMPKGVGPNMANRNTFKSCISEAQAADPDADFFSGRRDGNCTREGFQVSGGRVKGTVTCTGEQGPMTMEMEGSYAPESYDVSMDIKTGEMTMQIRAEGKRIGDCPAG